MRLNKFESVLLVVAMVAVACFSGFLKGEMRRAERERNRHDVGTIVEAACANLSAAELELNDNGRLVCGSVSQAPESQSEPVLAREMPAPMTSAANGVVAGTQSR